MFSHKLIKEIMSPIAFSSRITGSRMMVSMMESI